MSLPLWSYALRYASGKLDAGTGRGVKASSRRSTGCAQVFGDLGMFQVFSPRQRRTVEDFVCHVAPRTALDKKAHRVEVISADCLVERSRVAVEILGIEPVRVLTGVEKHLYNLGVAELRSERERRVTRLRVGQRKKATRFIDDAE